MRPQQVEIYADVHLFFDRHTKVLDHVNPIGHLQRLRRPLAGSLCAEATAIFADDLNLRLSAQPFCATLHIAICQNVDNRAAFEIDDDCSVTRLFSPAPIMNTGVSCDCVDVADAALEVTKDRIVTDWHAQSMHESLSGPSTCGMAHVFSNLCCTRRATSTTKCN